MMFDEPERTRSSQMISITQLGIDYTRTHIAELSMINDKFENTVIYDFFLQYSESVELPKPYPDLLKFYFLTLSLNTD